MGPFVKIIFQTAGDIRYFLVILLFVIIGFSLSFLSVVRGATDDFSDIGISLFTNYRFDNIWCN